MGTVPDATFDEDGSGKEVKNTILQGSSKKNSGLPQVKSCGFSPHFTKNEAKKQQLKKKKETKKIVKILDSNNIKDDP